MKTQKRKVGRPKLKKEVKAKKKKETKKTIIQNLLVEVVSELAESKMHLAGLRRLIWDGDKEIANTLSKILEEVKKLTQPKTPPMEEPKSEETPH